MRAENVFNVMENQIETVLRYFGRKKFASILDSSLKENGFGRYTIIGFDPFLVFRSKDGASEVIRGENSFQYDGQPLEILQDLLNENKNDLCVFPNFGGCIGYFSYDLLDYIEKITRKNVNDLGTDDIIVCFYRNGIVIDGNKATFSNEISEKEFKLSLKYNSSYEKPFKSSGNLISNFSKTEYIKAVEKAKEYIREGDIFQVNISQRFQIEISEDPVETFIYLRNTSPAPYSAFMNYGDTKIISTSPERFFNIIGNVIETKPIKGTISRGNTKEEDEKNREILLSSKKDLAELTMIVDLERNDIGKICEFGSVSVEKHQEIETYSNVFHTVSSIVGRLKESVELIDVIKATFPGGSITGAPKVRAMEIIEELEPVRRGIYTGAIGYMGFDGYVDLNIAIRTIVIKGKLATFHVGGGIVWDSDPEKEYDETLSKGKMLAEALSFGLFETLLVNEDGEVPSLEKHLARIKLSAEFFGFEMPTDAGKEIEEFIRENSIRNQILRVTVKNSELSFKVRENPYTLERKALGYKLLSSRFRKNENSIFVRHKTTRNLDNLNEIRLANELGYDDVIFTNSKGFITETGKCNLFFWKDGVLFTPSIDSGLLPGVQRESIIFENTSSGNLVVEKEVLYDELLHADEVFVTNSVMKSIKVEFIDDNFLH